jgi:biuret amidohydrolase
MSWKTAYRSFYYAHAPEPPDLILNPAETVMLSIEVQDIDLEVAEDPAEAARWFPFHRRMREIVIPTTRGLQDAFRAKGMDVIHARIACLLENGRDRSFSCRPVAP